MPESARDTRPARFQCRICNKRFPEFGPFERHVLTCSKEHENELADAAVWHQEFHAAPDPEWESFNEDLRREYGDPSVQFGRPKNSVKRLRES